jgi:hypothetical protein
VTNLSALFIATDGRPVKRLDVPDSINAHYWALPNGQRGFAAYDLLSIGGRLDVGDTMPTDEVYECVQLHPGALVAPEVADYLYVVWLRVDPVIEDEWNRWYNEEHVPQLSEVTGVLCARRFKSAVPDRLGRNYLAIYHMAAPDIYLHAEWKQASDSPWTRKMKPHHQADKSLLLFERSEFAGA